MQPFELLLDQDRISKRIAQLGQQITRDYKGKSPILLGVLKGCIVFMADLMRVIKLPVEIEFVAASSYRKGRKSASDVHIGTAGALVVTGRDVLIVEGVVDTGHTVMTLMNQLRQKEPASIEVVALIDKPASHRMDIEIKYKGFSVGNEFVIGYGLDNTQKYRNLPFIGRMVDRQ